MVQTWAVAWQGDRWVAQREDLRVASRTWAALLTEMVEAETEEGLAQRLRVACTHERLAEMPVIFGRPTLSHDAE